MLIKWKDLIKAGHTIKTNRKVYFTNLAPGNYTFKVKAANSSGTWTENTRQLRIEILPPFWATTWAYIIYVITNCCYYFLADAHVS